MGDSSFPFTKECQGADIRIILHRMLENPIRGQRPHDPFFSAPRKILFGPSDPHDLMITSSKNTELTFDRFFGTRSLHARDHASTASETAITVRVPPPFPLLDHTINNLENCEGNPL